MNVKENKLWPKKLMTINRSNNCKSIINIRPKEPSCLFFNHNSALGPPYRIIIDTNFINFSIQNKLDIFKSSMDCLLGKCIPYITDCVIG